MATEVMPATQDPSFQKDGREFRNYVNSSRQERVANFYKINHEKQTLDFVLQMKKDFLPLRRTEMSLWDAILKLDSIVDQSDPDTDSSQIIHNLQTAESIRRAWPSEEYDWFHLVGFIHDCGKLLSYPQPGFDLPQYAVVGDTFPVGCKHSSKVVMSEFFQANSDSYHPIYSTKLGIYSEGIGFNNLHMSWGHDEYMYQVCVQNKCTLPEEALYIVRFHSFYAWHQSQEYDYLANDYDRKMLPWLREFQKHDLYSKLPEKPDLEKLLPYYKGLVDKYFPALLKW
jgi:inositol oxygenase